MRNWKKVNEKYIQEGYIYFSFEFLKNWEKELEELNQSKEGARFKYPDSLVRFLAAFKAAYGAGARQLEGMLLALGNCIPIPSIISFSQINRRINALGLDLVASLEKSEDGQIIAIDSSGIKLYNSGQWVREKHKKKSPFLKLHVSVNIKTKQAVAIDVTEDSVGDNKLALRLVDESRKVKRVSKALMDGAYDTYEIWNGLNARSIKPLIRLRKNAVINYSESETRSQAVKCYIENEKDWVKGTGFGQRWQVETYYSSFKRRFGEHCFSRRKENVLHEILMKCCLLNKLIV
jgi:hypothetical protein